jgi:hypothetical protein
MAVADSEDRPANSQPADAFSQADLDSLKERLKGVRLPLPPRFEHPGSVRDAIRFFGLDPAAPPLERVGEPVDPLQEIGQYYLEHCRDALAHGQVPMDEVGFIAEHVLFLHWRWGADFHLWVAREAWVEAWHRRIEERLEAALLTRQEAAAARAASPAGSAVDLRQLPLPTPEPAPLPPKHVLIGNELNDEPFLDEIGGLIAQGMSDSEAINRVYKRAPRLKDTTSDKQVKARLKGKLKKRRQQRQSGSAGLVGPAKPSS